MTPHWLPDTEFHRRPHPPVASRCSKRNWMRRHACNIRGGAVEGTPFMTYVIDFVIEFYAQSLKIPTKIPTTVGQRRPKTGHFCLNSDSADRTQKPPGRGLGPAVSLCWHPT